MVQQPILTPGRHIPVFCHAPLAYRARYPLALPKLCSNYRRQSYKTARWRHRGLVCEDGEQGSSGESSCGASHRLHLLKEGQRTDVNEGTG